MGDADKGTAAKVTLGHIFCKYVQTMVDAVTENVVAICCVAKPKWNLEKYKKDDRFLKDGL